MILNALLFQVLIARFVIVSELCHLVFTYFVIWLTDSSILIVNATKYKVCNYTWKAISSLQVKVEKCLSSSDFVANHIVSMLHPFPTWPSNKTCWKQQLFLVWSDGCTKKSTTYV